MGPSAGGPSAGGPGAEAERRNEIAARLSAVRARIAAACRAAGRSSDEVTLIAVTKTRPVSDIRLLREDRKSTRLNSSHTVISYAVFCLKKKKKTKYIWHNTLLERQCWYKAVTL